jgi:hypothetical protein
MPPILQAKRGRELTVLAVNLDGVGVPSVDPRMDLWMHLSS